MNWNATRVMSEKRQQINDLFSSALEQSPGEREAFLRQACGNDQSLYAEVETLLLHYDDSFLEESPASEIPSFPDHAMVGKQIGAYRIIRECGHGGMAVVYLAERADGEYRKRVAVKMVKPGAGKDDILRRFRNERQTLAALDHPNIVKLLDGGSTEEGLPYLVMEYVEGIPVDQYCDSHKLSVPKRLQLFRTICEALHYAHQKLVIHRDLKPSNILITNDGTPRLMDFGIAKLLNPECFQTELVTLSDRRPMTPQYASPEQVRGEPVTPATDIYSLGVLLYYLLTGRRPYGAAGLSRFELERLVCEVDPEKPSTKVQKVDEVDSAASKGKPSTSPEVLSQARDTSPEGLRRILRGDLDMIVMMALRKEPKQRYASAKAFANDIERHLSGLPVKARRPTTLYRGSKFLRRHHESVAAALIALMLMAGVSTWEARRISRQASSRNAATFRARPSVAILGFKDLSTRPETAWLSTALSEMLTTELAAGEQLRTVPGETVARTKIDLHLPDTDSLASDTLARVRQNLGSDFVVLGSYLDLGKDGGGQLRLDLRLQDTERGDTVASISEVGNETDLLQLVSRTGSRLRGQLGVGAASAVESAAVQASVPSNPEATRLYSQGLAKLRAFDALAARDILTKAVAADPSYPLAHSALAKAWIALGYETKARDEAKQALNSAAELSREDHLLVEARYYEADKQWGKAMEAYATLFSFFPDNLEYGLYLASAQTAGGRGKDALASVQKLRSLPGEGKDDPRIDSAEQEAAYSLSDNQATLAAAEKTITKASASGANLVLARARSFQCRSLADVGRPEASKLACDEAARIYQQAGDLSGVARTLHSIAEVPLNQGDLDHAKKLYEQALSISRQIGDRRGVGREMGNIGLIYAQQGYLARAEQIYRESIAITREIGDKAGLAVDLGNLGDLLHSQARFADALASYTSALELAREVGHQLSVSIDLQEIGDVLADQGDLDAAMKNYDKALAIQRDIGSRSYYAGTLLPMGNVLRQKGDAAGAKKAYEEALSIRQQLGERGTSADTQLALAQLACDLGHGADAEPLILAAMLELHAAKETDHEILAAALLSQSLLQQAKLPDAQKTIADALKLAAKSQDVTVRLALTISNAYLRTALHDIAGAQRIALDALAETTRLGYVPMEFEASLALGAIEMQGNNPAAGRDRLARLEKAARSKGFELIARKSALQRNQ